MTLKERGSKGTKGYTVIDKHQVAEKTHLWALDHVKDESNGKAYKLQGMQALFEKLLKEGGKEAIEGHEQEQDFVISKLKELIEAGF